MDHSRSIREEGFLGHRSHLEEVGIEIEGIRWEELRSRLVVLIDHPYRMHSLANNWAQVDEVLAVHRKHREVELHILPQQVGVDTQVIRLVVDLVVSLGIILSSTISLLSC